MPCDNGANTCITYNVTGTTIPDHLGIFLRSEAVLLSASGSYSVTTACGKGDSVLGLGSNLLCHERLIRFDNRAAKAVTFTLKVQGKRLPIITTVATRKGSSQCANPIVGIGLEAPPAPESCVSSCGNFDPNQSVRKVETFKFKDCEATFEFDTASGAVTNFFAAAAAGAPVGTECNATQGPISNIFLSNPDIPEGNNNGVFGDGWLNSGNNSCSTRLVGGRYYTTCY